MVHVSEMLEKNYQLLLDPFKNANVYYPPTLKEYLLLTKQKVDKDEWLVVHNAMIIQTLIEINETSFPHECQVIREKCKSILSITAENLKKL